MTPRHLLSPQARAALFDPPMEVRAIVRHYTFSIEDVSLIRQRRRNANRLGFAVHLAYLRFPGRVLGPNEIPPAHLLAFAAEWLDRKTAQIIAGASDFKSNLSRGICNSRATGQ